MNTLLTKQCCQCLQEKPAAAFIQSRKARDGLSRKCRECLGGRFVAKFSPERKEELRQYRARYYSVNRNKLLEQNAQYRMEHREHLRQLDIQKYDRVKQARENAGKGRQYRKSVDGMLECGGCREVKPLAEFHRSTTSVHGYTHYCKSCVQVRAAVHYYKHREAILLKQSLYRDRHRDQINQKQNTQYGQATTARYLRDSYLKYGLTEGAYFALLDHQRESCLTCLSEFRYEKRGDTPQIDHDHVTGKVRGLLCVKCNTALGMARDNPLILRRMATYVEQGAAA